MSCPNGALHWPVDHMDLDFGSKIKDVGIISLQTPRVNQLATGSQIMEMEKGNGKRRKPEAQTAEAKCISWGVERGNFCDIPGQYHFFPYSFGFLFTVGLCFWRWGGLGWGMCLTFTLLVFLGPWKALDVLPLLRKALSFSFFPPSFRLFMQFCLPEPAGGAFLDM